MYAENSKTVGSYMELSSNTSKQISTETSAGTSLSLPSRKPQISGKPMHINTRKVDPSDEYMFDGDRYDTGRYVVFFIWPQTNCGRLMLWVCRCRASVETMVSMNSPLLYFTDPCLRIKLWIYLCGCSTNRFQTRGSKCKQRRFSDFVCGAFICFGEVVKCFSFTEKYI